MSQFFLLALVAATSAAAYGLARKRLGARGSLAEAVGRTVETVGVAVVFHMVNVALIVAGTLALRAAGGAVSSYVGTDITLIILSFLQAVLFQFWRYAGGGGRRP